MKQVWILAALLLASASGTLAQELISNTDFEANLTGWVRNGAGTLARYNSGHTGSWSCRHTGRTAGNNGPYQIIKPVLDANLQGHYLATAWLYQGSGSAITGQLQVGLRVSGVWTWTTIPANVPHDSWTKLSALVPLNWSGTLDDAWFIVNTESSTTTIYVDDSSLQKAVTLPTFTPAAGTYNTPQSVTISSATPGGATIRYTTDGSDPTSGTGTLYSGPVDVTATTTLKAIAYNGSAPDSAVASGAFTIAAATPTISPGSGEFVGSLPVTLTCATLGASIYYTTDNSTPTAGSTLYSTPFSLSADATVRAIAVKSGLNDSAVASASFVKLPAGSVLNGSFEYGTNAWTIAGTAYAILGNQGLTDGAKALTLNSANLQGDAVFQQTVGTVAGAAYALQFDFWAYGPKYHQMNAAVLNGASVITSTTASQTGAGDYSFTYLPYTLTFTALSGATAIRFTDQTTALNSIDSDSGLDHIRLSGTAAPPVISPNGGSHVSSVEVTLTCPTDGATIHYTTNGDTPTTASTTYSTPFALNASATVKAIAAHSDLADSAVTSATFTLGVATPTITPNGGTYDDSVDVTLASATPGTTFYYTTDGTPPTTGSTLYGGPFALTADANIQVLAVKSGLSDSAVASASFTVTSNPQVATPAISPGGGEFIGSTPVSMSCITAGAAIHYTTDGSPPTAASTLYSGPFAHSTTATIQAIGVKSGKLDSAVASASLVKLPAGSVLNGSFEYGTNGWIISSTDANPANYAVLNSEGRTDGAYAAAFGSVVNVAAGNAMFAQTLTTVPGAVYTILFDHGAFGNNAQVQRLLAEALDGATVLASREVTDVNAIAVFDPDLVTFNAHTLCFTGTSTSASIRFTDVTTLGGINCDGILDHVRATSAVATPTISPDGGAHILSVQVTLACGTQGAVIHYTTNGGTPTAASPVYSAPITLIASATVKAIAIASGLSDSAVASADFTITAQPQVASPTLSPAGGTFVDSVDVTLTSATPGASIYYTTDGSAPSAASIPYATPFTLTANAVVKAIAVKASMLDSAVAVGTFTKSGSESWVLIHVPGRVEAEDYRPGGEGVAYHDTTAGNSGGAYRSDNVDLQVCPDSGGGYNVGASVNTEWLEYNIDVAATGSYDFNFRFASAFAGTKTVVALIDGVAVSTNDYKQSDSYSVYHDSMIPAIPLTAGPHILRVYFYEANLNFNYLDITPSPVVHPVPGRVEAEAFKPGGQGVGYFDNTSLYNGGNAYRLGEGVDIELCYDTGGGYNVGNIQLAGEWLAYNVNVARGTYHELVLRVASASAGTKTLHAQVDGVTVATGSFTHADGWQTFHDLAMGRFGLTPGNHELKIFFDSENINLNYLNLTESPTTVFTWR
ncbi:MAG: chitobiase/beta-hexosaminidase C-terminal domain-containing protein [Lentisphaerae bacterium]|nr:chitobiase/beta-hexosaminidase C-terminal domain-containing protein [Lentisphaerota bacterium]